MEAWKRVWRDGFAPELTVGELRALLDGLRKDDSRISQGATTTPPPLQCVLDWPIEGACPLVFGGWQAGDYETVGDGEEHFAKLCFAADQRLGEPAACRWWLNWVDETPRDEMRRLMILEVERALALRGEGEADQPSVVVA